MRLVRPSMAYADEIMAYRAESLELAPHVNGAFELGGYTDPAAWIARCETRTDPAMVPEGDVVADEWMMVDDSRILGMVNIRRNLDDPFFAEYAGHIGYSIRPVERGRGYGTAQLMLTLDKCRDLSLEKVLLTCDTDNEASRRTILSCSGVFERTTIQTPEHPDQLERYWISL